LSDVIIGYEATGIPGAILRHDRDDPACGILVFLVSDIGRRKLAPIDPPRRGRRSQDAAKNKKRRYVSVPAN